jgi:hypothetical protein
LLSYIHVIASEAKQSSFAAAKRTLDCVVASLLAMTVRIVAGLFDKLNRQARCRVNGAALPIRAIAPHGLPGRRLKSGKRGSKPRTWRERVGLKEAARGMSVTAKPVSRRGMGVAGLGMPATPGYFDGVVFDI